VGELFREETRNGRIVEVAIRAAGDAVGRSILPFVTKILPFLLQSFLVRGYVIIRRRNDEKDKIVGDPFMDERLESLSFVVSD
jgi:hypothetical protein